MAAIRFAVKPLPMVKKPLLLIVLLIAFGATGIAQKKALFIIADGIPADIIEKLNTPALDAIAKKGGYTRAFTGGEKGGYSQTPTISAVSYNTILTGTWVNKHNVWDNDIAAPNYHYQTIFRLFESKFPEKKTAIFSSWLDNRTKLVGEGLTATGNIRLDHHFDSLEHDTITFPHDRERNFMHKIDEAVIDHAAAYIRSDAPDLSWIYLEYTDDMGHMHGDGDKFYRAVEIMDNQVKQIWDAIEYRQQQFGEEWMIVVTTDHGRDSATGKHHGGQSARERTGWIVTNVTPNKHFTSGAASIADIMPSIAGFLQLPLPEETKREVDGVPFTGPVAIGSPTATFNNGKLEITWKAYQQKGKANIWVTNSNEFKTGGSDKFMLLEDVKIKKQKAIVDVSRLPGPFYKIVIETPQNSVNRWVTGK